MQTLRHYASRLPLVALMLPLMLVATSCSRYNDNGSLSIAGVIYLILAIAAIISLLKQDWSVTKKIIWGVVIWFFPIGGSIIYFLFSGRK
ncbi:PLD nuclease N-terminal domain-containing protein [Hymenobacter artigasi]|uniref:Di/tricarboxylate transporter n=1 Tax=Hymenobacter artigasi TaxID=2719616 RepID=A0ABX1HG36_9BACT|nr:PLD nuclease N-terminal domain-containing protein [Hymenobacter artigasi]NKI88001.1 di/tricarboxylate transporter [Hymenobacter artigasi]